MEVGDDGAPLRAYVDEASGALCRPADFFGHAREWRTTAIRGFGRRSQKWSQLGPRAAQARGQPKSLKYKRRNGGRTRART